MQDPKTRPFAYAYRYPTFPPVGATVIRFNHGEEVNGSKPIEAIPLYSATEIEHLQSQLNPDVEKLAYSVANAKLGEGPAVRCEGPTQYEIAQARDWVRRVLAALKTVGSMG